MTAKYRSASRRGAARLRPAVVRVGMVTAFVALMSGAATPAMAQGSTVFDGAYGGVQGAVGTMESDLNGPRPAEGTTAVMDVGDTGVGAGLFAGYGRTFGRFYLGAEAEANIYRLKWEFATDPAQRHENSAPQWDGALSLRGGYMVSPVTLLYLRVGPAVAGYETEVIRRTGAVHNSSDELFGVRYGIGAEVAATRNLFMRLDIAQTRYDGYSIFFADGTDTFSDVTDTLVRLGIGYRFAPDGSVHPGFDALPGGSVDGLYVGIKSGYGLVNSNQEGPRAGGARQTADIAGGGAIGGAFIGAGQRVGRFYLGGEIEGTTGDIAVRQDAVVGGRLQEVKKEYDVAALLRGGYYLSPSLLLYGRAGVAMGNFETDVRLGDGRSFEQDEYVLGLRAGLGVEYAFDRHFFALLEYTYTQFERYGVDRSSPGQTAAGNFQIEEFTPVESMFWVGVGYRFGGNETGDEDAPKLVRGPDGKGIRLGSFIALPQLTVTQSYNSNIFATQTNEVDDNITTVTPSLALNSDWDKHEFDLWGTSDVVRYASRSSEDHVHYSFGADGRYDIARSTNAFGGGSYTRDVEDRESPDDTVGTEPTKLSITNGYAGVFHRFGQPAVRLGGTVRSYDFDDTPTSTGSINNDDRDRNVYTGGLWTGYQFQNGPEIWGQYSLDVRRYDQTPDDLGFKRDSRGYRALVGVNFKLGQTVDGSAYVGAMKQDYDDARLPTISGAAYGGNLDWEISPATEASLYVDRVIGETTLANASGSVDTTYGVSASQQILQKLRADAGFAITNSNYYGISREDNYASLNVGLRYDLTSEFFAGAGYEHHVRESDINGQNFNRNVFSLQVGGAF
jgi:hypothetical protein